MGLVSWVVGLPLAPVRGVVALGRVIQERAEQEMNDPANVRRQLEAVDEARESGELSQEDEEEATEQAIETLIQPRAPIPADEQESETER